MLYLKMLKMCGIYQGPPRTVIQLCYPENVQLLHHVATLFCISL